MYVCSKLTEFMARKLANLIDSDAVQISGFQPFARHRPQITSKLDGDPSG